FGREERGEALAGEVLRLEFLRAGIRERRAGEDAVEGVIVLRWHRVELVIVAAGAAEREPHERAAGRLDRVLQAQVPQLERRRGISAREREETGGGDARGIPLGRPPLRQEVAG